MIFFFIIGFIEVFNKIIYFWEDFEIYCLNFWLINLMEEIEKVRDIFYKGG